MKNHRAILVDECLGLAREGKEYLEIKNYLERKGLEKEEISIIMRLIGNDMERTAIKKVRAGYGREVKLAGLFLFLGGIFITTGTYLGLIGHGNVYVLAYGPIICGSLMMFSGQFWNHR